MPFDLVDDGYDDDDDLDVGEGSPADQGSAAASCRVPQDRYENANCVIPPGSTAAIVALTTDRFRSAIAVYVKFGAPVLSPATYLVDIYGLVLGQKALLRTDTVTYTANSSVLSGGAPLQGTGAERFQVEVRPASAPGNQVVFEVSAIAFGRRG